MEKGQKAEPEPDSLCFDKCDMRHRRTCRPKRRPKRSSAWRQRGSGTPPLDPLYLGPTATLTPSASITQMMRCGRSSPWARSSASPPPMMLSVVVWK